MISKVCDKFSYFLFLALLALIPFVYAPYIDTEMAFRVPKETVANFLIVLITGCWIIKWIDERYGSIQYSIQRLFSRKSYGFNRIFYVIALFMLYAIVSPLLGNNPFVGYRTSLNILYYFALLFFVTSAIQSEERKTTTLHVILLGGALSALYGIVQYLGHDPLFHPVETYMKGFLITSAFLDNPNLLAVYLVTVLPVAMFFLARSKSRLAQLFYSVITLVLFSTVLLTKSRMGLLSLFCAVLFIFVLFRWQVLKQSIAKIFALIVLLSVVFLVGNHFFMAKARKDLGLENRSGSVRLLHWYTASQMIQEDFKSFIVGKGPGSFTILYPEYRYQVIDKLKPLKVERARHAHNEYLQIWAEMGIIGLVFVLGILALFISEIIKALRLNPIREDKCVLILLSSSVIAVSVNAFASFPFHIVPPSLNCVVLGGIALSSTMQCNKAPFREV